MQTGTVAQFDAQLGFGFILRDNGGPDLFVYYTGIQGEGYRKLEKGQRVEYEVEIGPKQKPQACQVRVISEGGE
jgi:CspA family cold shock protein